MKIRCLYDELVPVSMLKEHPKNRNAHPEAQLKRLAQILEYQGWRYPIKVSKASGYITSGHGRLAAAKILRLDSVPVNYQEYESSEQEYADLQADNAIAAWAELDLSSINADLGDLGPDFNIDFLGIKDFVLEPADLVPQCDEDELPEKVEAKTKPGDLYQLGRHRLLCGDATLIDDVKKLVAGETMDIVWTDPPYNVNYEGKTKDKLKIENDRMGGEDFLSFLRTAFSNMCLVTKPGAAIYIAHADTEGVNFRTALVDAGFLFKQCLVWVKQKFVMGRSDYHWKHEPILYGWKEGGAHSWYGDRSQCTVLEFDRPSRSTEHPTMKPVELIEYCLGNSSQKGESVLDLFGGSGSTLITAEKIGRRAFLMELEPHYCDVIVARWQKFTGRAAELIHYEAL